MEVHGENMLISSRMETHDAHITNISLIMEIIYLPISQILQK